MAATTSDSLFLPAFDHGTGLDTRMDSPSLDPIHVTNSNGMSYMRDQGLDDTVPPTPSSILPFSPDNLSPDLHADYILDTMNASINSSDTLFATFCESVHGHGYMAGPDDKKGSPPVERGSLAATASNGAALAGSVGPRPTKHEDGWQNSLHIAAAKGHDRIARILLQHNIDCNEKDSDGLTPLIHATIGGYADVVRSLLSHGALIGAVDAQHRSALHWAVLQRREDVLKILLDWCASQQPAIDLELYDEAGRTPLHTAVDMGYDAGVQLLLQLGANAQYRTRKRK